MPMPVVRTENLIGAQEVTRILGLAHRNAVTRYQKRYSDMLRPVVDLGGTRPRLWLRNEVEDWLQHREPARRGRPQDSRTPAGASPRQTCSDNKAPLWVGCVSRGLVQPCGPMCRRGGLPNLRRPLRASLRTVAGVAGNGLASKEFEWMLRLQEWFKRREEARPCGGSRE